MTVTVVVVVVSKIRVDCCMFSNVTKGKRLVGKGDLVMTQQDTCVCGAVLHKTNGFVAGNRTSYNRAQDPCHHGSHSLLE